jgi:molybdopterin converting factor subunit 1
VRITVRLFARLRELVGAGELVRDTADDATVQTVWSDLARDYPSIAPYAESISCAVNAEYSRLNVPLRDGDEVAFLPPVSGGSSLAAPPGQCSTLGDFTPPGRG